MTLTETRPARRFGRHPRIAAKPHTCSICQGAIAKGEMYFVRPERVGRRLHSRREHHLCPIPDPIPTRPVPKHYSSAGEKKRGLTLTELVVIALLVALAASYLLASYWRGQ